MTITPRYSTVSTYFKGTRYIKQRGPNLIAIDLTVLNLTSYSSFWDTVYIHVHTVCLCMLAFNALRPLVGREEGYPACKNYGLMWCWCGYLSGARCKWFAYGSADATATPSSMLQQNPEWFILLVPAYPGCPGKKAVKRLCVCVCVCMSMYNCTYTEH